MGASDWHLRLRGMHSSGEVVSLAREFIAQWTPTELADLPEMCRPHRLHDPDDLSLYAFILAREERKPGPCNARLSTFAEFFAAVSTRLSEIAAIATEPRLKVFLTK